MTQRPSEVSELLNVSATDVFVVSFHRGMNLKHRSKERALRYIVRADGVLYGARGDCPVPSHCQSITHTREATAD
jgi:hypothetical protein